MPVAVPLAAAGIGAAATIGGAMISSNAASKAAAAQAQAQQQALAFQKQVYADTQQNQQPYMNVGKAASGTLSDIYGFGTGGPGSPNALENFVNTPDYQFTLGQGMRALDMSAASNHLLNSGGMVRAAQDYGQGLAATQFGNVIQRLMAMMNLGSSAAGSAGNAGVAMGQQVGNSFNSLGQAQASGIMGAANPWVSALNTGPGNALAAYKYFGGTMPGQGSMGSTSSYANPLASYGGNAAAFGGGIY